MKYNRIDIKMWLVSTSFKIIIDIFSNLCITYTWTKNNGGKQANVVDTTEMFCTKMCVFSACSALKLITNVIEWMIFSKADYLVQFLVSKANNYKLYKYCKQTRWPIRVHLKFQQLNRIMYKTPSLVVEAFLANVPYRALTNKWSLFLSTTLTVSDPKGPKPWKWQTSNLQNTRPIFWYV